MSGKRKWTVRPPGMRPRAGLPLLLAALILLAVFPLAAATTDVQVYHLAVNDTLIDVDTGLTAANMPIAVGGTIYVPYTIFDKNLSKVDLGISCSQVHEGGIHTLTLYSLSGTLKFDINAQTCESTNGPMDMRAVVRNGRVYLPANGVCQFFGLQYSYRPTRSAGVLIRIKNSYAVLDDTRFMRSAASLMQQRYDQYVQRLTVTPTPVSTPAATPAPPQPSPAPQPTQAPEDPEDSDRPEIHTRLAFACTGGQGLSAILDALSRQGLRTVFFFRPEQLVQQEAQVRAVLAAGHQVGLLVDGGDAAAGALSEGSRMLERIAWTRTHIACLDGGGRALRTTLGQEGWRFWTTQVDGRTDGSAFHVGQLISQVLADRDTVHILLDDSSVTAAALEQLFRRMEGEECLPYSVLETDLP